MCVNNRACRKIHNFILFFKISIYENRIIIRMRNKLKQQGKTEMILTLPCGYKHFKDSISQEKYSEEPAWCSG